MRRVRRAGRILPAILIMLATLVATEGVASAHTPHDPVIHVVLSPDYARDHTMFVISDVRVLRSTNSGASWQEITRGLGANIYVRFAIAPSDKKIMYVSSRGGGVYRSTDAGVSWKVTNNAVGMETLAEIGVSPKSADTAMVSGVFGGLFRTTDGGTHWTKLATPFGRVTAVLYPDRTGRVLVGDGRGIVYASDDNGTTWTAAGGSIGGGGISALGAAPATAGGPATVFAGTTTGKVAISTDSGRTFTPVGSGLPAEQVNGVATSPDYADDHTVWVSLYHTGAYRSTDSGATFAARGNGLKGNHQADDIGVSQYRNVTIAIAKEASGDQVQWEAGYDGLFRSDDDGANWREIQTQSEYVTSLAVSPNYGKDHTVAVSTYLKGEYISDDEGKTWTMRDTGLGHPLSDGNEFSPIRRMHNIVFSPDYANDNTIFTASWDKFIKSTDRGHTWTQIMVSPPPPDTPLRQFVIAVSPNYAADGTIFLGTRQGDMYVSTDRGNAGSWKELTRFGTKVAIRSIVMSPDFGTDHVMYVGTGNGIRRSDDAGRHWSATGPTGLAMLSISPNYPKDGTVFAGSSNGVFATRDHGKTWAAVTDKSLPPNGRTLATGAPVTAQVEAVAVSPDYAHDQTVLVSVRGYGLYKSTDGGKTFKEIGRDLNRANLLVADFTNPTSAPIQYSPEFAKDKTVYAMAQQTIVKSTDGGETWTALKLPSAQTFLARAAKVATPPSTGAGKTASSSASAAVPHVDSQSSTGVWYIVAIGVGTAVILLGVFLWSRRSRPSAAAKPAAETTS